MEGWEAAAREGRRGERVTCPIVRSRKWGRWTIGEISGHEMAIFEGLQAYPAQGY